MNKRQFIKSGSLAVAGLAVMSIPAIAKEETFEEFEAKVKRDYVVHVSSPSWDRNAVMVLLAPKGFPWYTCCSSSASYELSLRSAYEIEKEQSSSKDVLDKRKKVLDSYIKTLKTLKPLNLYPNHY